MRIVPEFQKQFKKEHIVIPTEIENDPFLKKLERALNNRNPCVISLIFRIAQKDENVSNIEQLLNKSMKLKRSLPKDDVDFINALVKSYRDSKKRYIIFNNVGNLLFIAKLVDELKKRPRLNKLISITCFLWLYQNIVEIIFAHISELFYVIAEKKQDINFTRKYKEACNKQEHLMRGYLLDFAKNTKNKFTSDKNKTFLHKNMLRDRLAHANCFFDPASSEIVLSTTEKLTLSEFKKEFKYVQDFLNELIFQLNSNQYFEIKNELMKMSRQFFRLSRQSNSVKYFKTQYKFMDD